MGRRAEGQEGAVSAAFKECQCKPPHKRHSFLMGRCGWCGVTLPQWREAQAYKRRAHDAARGAELAARAEGRD